MNFFRLETGIPGGRECRVGQYTVDVTSFEQTVLTELEIKVSSVDEIFPALSHTLTRCMVITWNLFLLHM